MSAKSDDIKQITNVMEDYLEAILVLSEEKGFTRITELAEKLGKEKGTVSEMVKTKLKKLKLVDFEIYGTISLTKKGKSIAQMVKDKHDMLKSFLILIGVDEHNAEHDCCIMEHDLTKNTTDQLNYFTEFLQGSEQKDILNRYKKYLQKFNK
ncbi:MAG: transcriptional regulator MntR [Asgard group archaeon]|nr:transcriptional regulator MntR [Asgard group archaeon]